MADETRKLLKVFGMAVTDFERLMAACRPEFVWKRPAQEVFHAESTGVRSFPVKVEGSDVLVEID